MWNVADALSVSRDDVELLESWVRASSTPQSIAVRANIVLMAAEGISNSRIAADLNVSRPTVILWRNRYTEGGVNALAVDKEGRGRKSSIPADTVARILEATLQTKPAAGTHWSCRTMAKAMGVSSATVQRIWEAHGLKPHRVKTFKLSRDPKFVEKLTDVVGLYLNPPDKAVVLCVDEKSQIQALDRTQPGLPMKPGRAGTMTHDYKRHGTTTLFAALNVLDGKIVGQCLPKHRHQEFLRFLRKIDREFPGDIPLHLILDNYGTHTHPKVKEWFAARPRYHLHFTPTSSSWLNLVERWFRELTVKRIRRGVFHSVPELIAAINEYLRVNNKSPQPFIWTATAKSILEKIKRCKAISETLH